MDRRRTRVDPEAERALRDRFYQRVGTGEMTVGQAVAAMRRISRLTQVEFAHHRGISLNVLKQIEADKANPTVETLAKIAAIFGLQVGFIPKAPRPAPREDI